MRKNFEIRTSIKQSLTKYQIFTKLPKFHIFTSIVIFQVYLQLFKSTVHPYKFHGRDMSGILFFIFASCEPLSDIHNVRSFKFIKYSNILYLNESHDQ